MMPNVNIHRREQVPDPSDPDGLRRALLIRYSTPTVPPRDVYVPGEDPSDQEIAEAIRKDLAERTGEQPSLFEV